MAASMDGRGDELSALLDVLLTSASSSTRSSSSLERNSCAQPRRLYGLCTSCVWPQFERDTAAHVHLRLQHTRRACARCLSTPRFRATCPSLRSLISPLESWQPLALHPASNRSIQCNPLQFALSQAAPLDATPCASTYS